MYSAMFTSVTEEVSLSTGSVERFSLILVEEEDVSADIEMFG